MLIEAYRWFFLRLADVVGIGWGIVALSVITSAAMMPLMKAVAGIVKRETDYQSVILPQLAEIKKMFSSDAERHMHIQRLYARYCYSPLSAVKKVLPLFVQIPFLILTYYMLKNTPQLSGVSFLFLDDLGQPDALLKTVGKFPLGLNVLPIVMTLVNMLTVAATPGFTHKDQMQAVGISLLFLVLLYSAPSALLLYWTLNNVITMIRTLATKHGEGVKLLLFRMVLLKNTPSAIRRATTPKRLAYASLSLILLTAYFCGTAKLMIAVNGGMACNVMYRGMAFVIAIASVVQFLHLRREPFVYKPILCMSMIVCVGFAAVLALLFMFSRMLFMSFLGWVDMFAAVSSLIVIWMLPYLIVKDSVCSGLLGDVLHSLCRNGWMLVFPIILAIHYAYSSAVFMLPLLSLLVFCVYMVLPCVILSLAAIALFRRWIEANTLFAISVGVFVGIYIVPMISTETGFFAYDKNLIVRIGLAGLMAALFSNVQNSRTWIVFQFVLLIAVVVNAAINHGREIATATKADEFAWRARMEQVVGDARCVNSNNVYLLVYDAYGHRSILDGLGLQDDGIYEYLKAKGYTIYDAYSVGPDTLTSMSGMFTFNNVGGEGSQATICGDNVFCDLLREYGYKTSYILLGYLMPSKNCRKPGDYYFPAESKITKPEMVLFPCVLRGALSQSPTVFDTYSMSEWLNEKANALNRSVSSGACSFVYAHMEYPAHAPWHPRYRKNDIEEQRMYGERLCKANEQMIKDIELLERDRNAIVILMGDHGGSLLIPEKSGTWDVKNLIDHFGIFLAIRWPKDYVPTLKLGCLQNVLVEVMIYLTGDKSLQRLEKSGRTEPLDYPFGTPNAVIEKGIIQFGDGAGENLFDASRRVFERREDLEQR